MDQHLSPHLHLPRRRAVVIDDDPEVRALHRQVLEPLGLEVVVATNAGDGLEAVRRFEPVVTFLDVTMPGMDGFAAASLIREVSDTYILMVSALGEEIDVVQGLGAGADDYVCKPFRPRELRARVEAMLRRPRTTVGSCGEDPTATRALHVTPEPRPWAPTVLPGPHDVPVRTAAPDPRPVPRSQPRAVTFATSSGSSALTVVAPHEELAETEVAPTPEVDPEGWLHHGSLTLHPVSGTVRADGLEVELDDAETTLLTTLMETGTRVRSVAHLVLSLRGEGYVTTYFVNDADRRAVTEHVESLRRKLGDTGPTPRWIEPVRSVGFRMTAG